MADLDDFFAKKDRKKSKTVKKFATADEVAKKLEDTTKKIEKPSKKERGAVTQTQDTDEIGNNQHDSDEWKDFEEEKKDYTGLKIGHLTITGDGEKPSSEQTDGSGGGTAESNQTGSESVSNETDRKAGPWKRFDSATEGADPTEPQSDPIIDKATIPEPATAPAPKYGGYVPPHLRNQSAQQQQLQSSRLKTKTAPDIHNEEYFPTLSGGKQIDNNSVSGAWGRRNRPEGNFEEIRPSKASSHRQVEQSKLNSGQGPKLNLGNRYGTLSNENTTS